jgi:hypothetical protein
MSEFIPHAIDRFFERTDLEVTRNQITNAIEGGNVVYAKRLTASKSLAYVMVGENVIKLIISKGTKKVLSIIPWKSVFKEVINVHFGTTKINYEAILFPDCYMETGCSHALTKIHRLHDDGAREPIPYNHPYFEMVFNMAWDKVANSEKHIQIQKERQSGNEKIKTQVHTGETAAA